MPGGLSSLVEHSSFGKAFNVGSSGHILGPSAPDFGDNDFTIEFQLAPVTKTFTKQQYTGILTADASNNPSNRGWGFVTNMSSGLLDFNIFDSDNNLINLNTPYSELSINGPYNHIAVQLILSLTMETNGNEYQTNDYGYCTNHSSQFISIHLTIKQKYRIITQ